MTNVQKQYRKAYAAKTGAGDLDTPITITYQSSKQNNHGEPTWVEVAQTRAKVEIQEGYVGEQGVTDLIRSAEVTCRRNSLHFLHSSISPAGFIIHVKHMSNDATIKVEDTIELNDYFIMRGKEGVGGDTAWPPVTGGIPGVPNPGHPTHPIVKTPKALSAQVNNTHLQIAFDLPITLNGDINNMLQVQYPDANGHMQNRQISNAIVHDKILIVEVNPSFEKQDINIKVKYHKSATDFITGGRKVKDFVLPVKNTSTYVYTKPVAPGLMTSTIDEHGNFVATYDNSLATTGMDRVNNVEIRVNTKPIVATKIDVVGPEVRVTIPGPIYHSDLVEYEYKQHTGSSIIDHVTNLELMPQTYVVTNTSTKVMPVVAQITPTYTLNVGPGIKWSQHPGVNSDDELSIHDSALYGQPISASGAKMRKDTGFEWLPKAGTSAPSWYVLCFENAQNGGPTISCMDTPITSANGGRHDGWVIHGNKLVDPTDKVILDDNNYQGLKTVQLYTGADIPQMKYQDKTIIVIKQEIKDTTDKGPDTITVWYNGHKAHYTPYQQPKAYNTGLGMSFFVWPNESGNMHNSDECYLKSIRKYAITETEADVLDVKWSA